MLKGVSGGVGVADTGVGTVASTPHNLLNKITGHGGENVPAEDPDTTSFSATIDEITGLTDCKYEIQVRFYLLGEKEREVYRSAAIKLEEGNAMPNMNFDFRAIPLQELGVKVVTVKSLGRHSDITQTSTDLEPGTKEIQLTKSGKMRVTISQEEANEEDEF